MQLNCTPDLTPRPKRIIQSTNRLQLKKSKELNCWKPGEAFWGWFHLRKHLYQLSRPCFCCADDSTSKFCSRILNFMFAKFVVKLIHRKPVPHIIRRKAKPHIPVIDLNLLMWPNSAFNQRWGRVKKNWDLGSISTFLWTVSTFSWNPSIVYFCHKLANWMTNQCFGHLVLDEANSKLVITLWGR